MTTSLSPCGLCGGSTFRTIYPGTISDPDQRPEQYYASSRTVAGYLPIVQCQNCGLVMTNPRDDAATLAAIYANLADEVYDAEEQNRQRVARQRIRLIAGCATQAAPRLLDLGCATGIFAGAAQAAGWQAHGLEPSAWAIRQARQRFPAVAFSQGKIEDAVFSPGSFDVITLWDVLEHVPEPALTLKKIHPWLAEDGWLLINVPDIASLPARLMGKHWVLMLREHLWYFSPATLEKLLEQCGYQMIETRANTVWFSLGNIFRRLAQYSAKPAGKRPPGRRKGAGWLDSISIQFPMGELTVMARKR